MHAFTRASDKERIRKRILSAFHSFPLGCVHARTISGMNARKKESFRQWFLTSSHEWSLARMNVSKV
jgi:hypothetical protein